MTDINEAIARWMGHTEDKPANTPYDLSLDLQVPVWEALKEKHNLNFYLEAAGDTFCAWFEWVEYGSSPAEAGARAIHAALVALGEVTE